MKSVLKGSNHSSPYKKMDPVYDSVQFNPTPTYRKITASSKQTTGCLFSNFEDVQLSDEERVYLNAAGLGDMGVIRMSLEASEDDDLNVNCVDYMGRNALHLAVDSENIDVIEMLLDRINFECIEEALLHAISKGSTKIVRVIIEHPNYMAAEDKIKRMDYNNAFFRTTEKSQFSPDITPLILSAHYNNHEIIQMFLSRSHSIEKPHSISCHCNDCQVKQDYDSLKRSRSRLNAYRALASPAYMALSSQDPIMTTFELRQEMMKLAEIEKEFKREYLELVEQCMIFACEMMDLCRGTQEVEAVISDNIENDIDVRDALGRLRTAIRYEEKKFVAHPNCQQYLTSLWYGAETGFLQSWSLLKKISLSTVTLPLMPALCMLYIVAPTSYLARSMRCPAIKFATHCLSHVCFLILLSAATFRVEVNSHPIRTTEEFLHENRLPHQQKVLSLLKEKLRPASTIVTSIQICIVLWVLGMLVMEIKQVYFAGMTGYIHDINNVFNFCVLKLYTASYTLRILVDQWVSDADRFFNGTTIAKQALEENNFQLFNLHLQNISNSVFEKKYFMEASRFNWTADDPEIVSDVLFAVANLISFSRTIYLMPAFEMLGPLQISFNRMILDITRFMVLFVLVLFAFMVGLHNLYWYYGSQVIRLSGSGSNLTKNTKATEVFEGLTHTLYTLFWAMFGQTSLSSIPLKHPDGKDPLYSDGMINPNSSTAIVEGVGMFLMAIYHVIIIIVLVNMLIAMMSHSFEDIQVDCDVEWKFARTQLWLNFVDNGSTLPVPFNLIPTPHSLFSAIRFVKRLLNGENVLENSGSKATDFIRVQREQVCNENRLENTELSYSNIMQRLVRRYLFKMERQKDSDDKPKDSGGVRNDDIFGQASEVYPTGLMESPKTVQFADSEEQHAQQSSLGPPTIDLPTGPSSAMLARRATLRKPFLFGGFNRRRSSSIYPPVPPQFGQAPPSNIFSVPSSAQGGGGAPQQSSIQLITLPQLDGILRSQKILDMRLQNLQSQSEQLNCASGNARIKEEIEHVRLLVGENLTVLSSILSAVFKIQEVVTSISNNMQQWFTIQSSGNQLRTVIVDETKFSNRSRLSDTKI